MQSANGRIHPEKVLVNGQEERHPEGAFYIGWREAGKLIRRSVGKQSSDAAAARRRQEAALNAQANGVRIAAPISRSGAAPVSTEPELNTNPEGQAKSGNGTARRQLQSTVTEYLDEIKLTKKPATHKATKPAWIIFSPPEKRQLLRTCRPRWMVCFEVS